MTRRPSRLDAWPRAFDGDVELDWGDAVVSRRLLREHLDQTHDGASRRLCIIREHVRRLRRLLPEPPADVLDAAAGPGLYSVRLAAAGYRVTALDIGPAVVAHTRRLAREQAVSGDVAARVADLRTIEDVDRYDAVLLIYHVLEAFPRRQQVDVLRRLRRALRSAAPLVVEMRLRPDQVEGRISSWDVVKSSLLSERRHLLLVETVHDRATNTYVLRETAVFDDGTTAVQQTSSAFTRYDAIPSLFARAGLRVDAMYDGWSRFRASALSESVLVVARRL
ncbi:MAG TPA: class I SAM-dependent methyltransferase [Candidatus Deferrimicrobium sp.]|nr:class I SAM-dependent methyltransferase [Candidatus Deferrimicrobium sp.]